MQQASRRSEDEGPGELRKKESIMEHSNSQEEQQTHDLQYPVAITAELINVIRELEMPWI